MWNERLAQLATKYPTGVLSVADVGGYPASVRLPARLDTKQRVVTFPALPAYAQGWRGKACLLFHRHNSRLEGLHQMVLKGELEEVDGAVVLRVIDFVTNRQTNTVECHTPPDRSTCSSSSCWEAQAKRYSAGVARPGRRSTTPSRAILREQLDADIERLLRRRRPTQR